MFHDIYDYDDGMPMCCVDDCNCGVLDLNPDQRPGQDPAAVAARREIARHEPWDLL